MTKATKLLRKFIAVLIGLPILALGVVFIPLPGPGLLLCLLGLFILASEFEAAKPYRDKAQKELKKIIAAAKAKQKEINDKYNSPN